MHTSAQALHELLTVLSQHRKKEERFIDVLASYFGLEGESGKLEAVCVLHKLICRVRDDIQAADIDEKDRNLVRSYLNPLSGVLSLSHVSQNIEQCRKQFLDPKHVNSITLVHLALDRKVNRYDPREDFQQLASEVNDLKQKILNSNLPKALKSSIIDSLNLIQAALEHVTVWGLDGLEEALAKLVGRLAIANTSDLSEEQLQAVNPIAQFANRTCKALSQARKAAEDMHVLYEKLPAISDGIALLPNFPS